MTSTENVFPHGGTWCLCSGPGTWRSFHQTLLFAHHWCMDTAVPRLANPWHTRVPDSTRWTHQTREAPRPTRTLNPIFRFCWVTWETWERSQKFRKLRFAIKNKHFIFTTKMKWVPVANNMFVCLQSGKNTFEHPQKNLNPSNQGESLILIYTENILYLCINIRKMISPRSPCGPSSPGGPLPGSPVMPLGPFWPVQKKKEKSWLKAPKSRRL